MQTTNDSTRILRMAAWIWIGFLLAMLVMDSVLYLPQVQGRLGQTNPAPLQQFVPGQPGLPVNPPPLGSQRLIPVVLYYFANLSVAFLFLIFTYWTWIQAQMGRLYYPALLLAIAVAPILINVLVVPRFPQGPLSNAEGMALRQLPVLFVALALVAWEYRLPHIIFFSVSTAALELILIFANAFAYQNLIVFIFIAIIRTISFIALGIFISLLVTQLREQRESLRAANANLTHYASTLEQLTVSRERNRLARELHDTLAHSLTAISVSLETAKAYFDVDSNKLRGLIETSLEATRKGVDETRRALKSLRSSALEDLGLGLAIQRAAESAAARFHLNLTLDLPDPMPSLSPDVEQTLYRIAQEAIENITSHSQARNFSVHLKGGGHVELVIQDDGVGFDPHARNPVDHFGLVGMRERAELTGGTLKIESEKGKGTRVVLTI
ncbi:MAG: sensor histidine kinase [Chloroflexi bacterium]|nr:sensor histidine kinase [Chloroflexota bacterium]